ncbi:triose-phosphate isomerase [Candidatus Peregrinibacteria bacterium]|nr:triose-phosphate isomerase [Candidatus Peregrinibacteria bacterium]
MIITNFKTYESASGAKAVELARVHERVAKETGQMILVAVQAIDLASICASVQIPVLAQHIDAVGYGGNTGSICAESVKNAGAWGTLLNHSEKRLNRELLSQSILRAREVGLKIILCAATPEEGASFLEFEPDYIAVEPPDLIGGDVSVTTRPEVVRKAVELIGGLKLLVGAGVKTGEDVRIAKTLGASGVLLASGVTKTKDPKAVLLDLANGLRD